MKPAIFKPQSKAKQTKDRIARWISFAALVALLAMATLPLTSGPRAVADQGHHALEQLMARVTRELSAAWMREAILVVDGAAPSRHFWSRWMDRALGAAPERDGDAACPDRGQRHRAGGWRGAHCRAARPARFSRPCATTDPAPFHS